MRNRAILLSVVVAVLSAQTPAWRDPARAVAVRVNQTAPLEVVSRDCGRTEIRPRGGVAVIDLNCRLELRNTARKPLRGAALSVSTQPVLTLGNGQGGRAAVFVPSLHVEPGRTFPVTVRVRLLSPAGSSGALAEIAVDGALLADLSYAGADAADSRRKLTRYEAEARIDRERLRLMLASDGGEGLRAEMLSTLERQARRPTLEARALAQGRTVSGVSNGPTDEGTYQSLAFVALPDAPLNFVSGAAGFKGATLRGLGVEVRNVSDRAVRAFDVEWLVRDAAGRRHRVGGLPFSPESLAPGGAAEVSWSREYELTRSDGAAFEPSKSEAYLRRVEFEDGTVWKPSRAALAEADLLDLQAVTPEEQRLAAIYRKDGLQGLIAELDRF